MLFGGGRESTVGRYSFLSLGQYHNLPLGFPSSEPFGDSVVLSPRPEPRSVV